MRVPEEQNRPLTYSKIAPKLAEYSKFMGFTHVQLICPRFHDSRELRVLLDRLHAEELGVILETDLPPNDRNGKKESVDGHCMGGETFIFEHEYKSDAAWAEETIAYFATDPLYRKLRHAQFCRRDSYAFKANYILPLSHMLVMPPRPSLLTVMPGDYWQKFANLRLLFAYMYLLPGKKLVFMGDEFGQPGSWQSETSLDWHVASETGLHGRLRRWVSNLNRFYRDTRALHETDSHSAGIEWIDTSDAELSVLSFLRRDRNRREILLVVLNFTPVPRHNYRVGVPKGGFWAEELNSDAVEFGGSGHGNLGGAEAAPFGWNFQSHSLVLTLPPLAAIVLNSKLS
jgi:1,4-alpha-glucan branching enzyme